MHYTAAFGMLSSVTAAREVPDAGTLYAVARGLLNAAGALFALYLLVAAVLAVTGILWRARRRGLVTRQQPRLRADGPPELT